MLDTTTAPAAIQPGLFMCAVLLEMAARFGTSASGQLRQDVLGFKVELSQNVDCHDAPADGTAAATARWEELRLVVTVPVGRESQLTKEDTDALKTWVSDFFHDSTGIRPEPHQQVNGIRFVTRKNERKVTG